MLCSKLLQFMLELHIVRKIEYFWVFKKIWYWKNRYGNIDFFLYDSFIIHWPSLLRILGNKKYIIFRMGIWGRNLVKLGSTNLDGITLQRSLLYYYFFKHYKTPLIDEIIFRELVNNAINVRY